MPDINDIIGNASGIVSRAEMRKMLDEMPDDASGALIIADTSPCQYEDDDDPGVKIDCPCGHYNNLNVYRFGKMKKVPHMVYLMQTVMNCLFNR